MTPTHAAPHPHYLPPASGTAIPSGVLLFSLLRVFGLTHRSKMLGPLPRGLLASKFLGFLLSAPLRGALLVLLTHALPLLVLGTLLFFALGTEVFQFLLADSRLLLPLFEFLAHHVLFAMGREHGRGLRWSTGRTGRLGSIGPGALDSIGEFFDLGLGDLLAHEGTGPEGCIGEHGSVAHLGDLGLVQSFLGGFRVDIGRVLPGLELLLLLLLLLFVSLGLLGEHRSLGGGRRGRSLGRGLLLALRSRALGAVVGLGTVGFGARRRGFCSHGRQERPRIVRARGWSFVPRGTLPLLLVVFEHHGSEPLVLDVLHFLLGLYHLHDHFVAELNDDGLHPIVAVVVPDLFAHLPLVWLFRGPFVSLA
mmetsp:Transcript_11521/g.33252  ORF Transcript_11521/g.33252 Transcript_11521/m.33252 type:complete len:364 (-) Transcript_11521:118-1209(-)